MTESIGNPVFGLVGDVTGADGDSDTLGDSADGDDTAGPVGTNDKLRDDRAGNHTTTVPV